MTTRDPKTRHISRHQKRHIKRKTKNRNRKGHIRGISDEARRHIPKIPPTRFFPFLPPFPTFPLLAAGASDSSPTTTSRRWCCWCRRRAHISLSLSLLVPPLPFPLLLHPSLGSFIQRKGLRSVSFCFFLLLLFPHRFDCSNQYINAVLLEKWCSLQWIDSFLSGVGQILWFLWDAVCLIACRRRRGCGSSRLVLSPRYLRFSLLKVIVFFENCLLFCVYGAKHAPKWLSSMSGNLKKMVDLRNLVDFEGCFGLLWKRWSRRLWPVHPCQLAVEMAESASGVVFTNLLTRLKISLVLIVPFTFFSGNVLTPFDIGSNHLTWHCKLPVYNFVSCLGRISCCVKDLNKVCSRDLGQLLLLGLGSIAL